jgi:hypothetical protein
MTPTVTEGKHGQFLWLERSIDARAVDRPLIRLTKHCPDVLLGKRVVVTALDSGPFRPNEVQLNAGWKRDGRFAISPRISDAGDVPFCGCFDEWYVFDDAVPVTLDIQVFVNMGTFSLGEPNPTIDTMYIRVGPFRPRTTYCRGCALARKVLEPTSTTQRRILCC